MKYAVGFGVPQCTMGLWCNELCVCCDIWHYFVKRATGIAIVYTNHRQATSEHRRPGWPLY